MTSDPPEYFAAVTSVSGSQVVTPASLLALPSFAVPSGLRSPHRPPNPLQRSLVAGNRDAGGLLTSSASNANLADEALYRHYPPVSQGASCAGGGSILDTANSYTFETLNRKLASRWCSSSPSSRPSCCPSTDSVLADKAQQQKQAGNTCGVSPSPAAAAEAAAECGGPCAASATCSASSQLLFLVRHGETDMNKAGKLQGRGVNAHLNENGLEQAQGLGRFVRNVPFDTVTSSSLSRAPEVRVRGRDAGRRCGRYLVNRRLLSTLCTTKSLVILVGKPVGTRL